MKLINFFSSSNYRDFDADQSQMLELSTIELCTHIHHKKLLGDGRKCQALKF
jgi:hypothetical protein